MLEAGPDGVPVERQQLGDCLRSFLNARNDAPGQSGQTPLARPGQPAELASIYVQLAAADASYATGQVYGASGGSGQP